MGCMRHHAVLVTSFDHEAIEQARVFALDLVTFYDKLNAAMISPLASSPVNGFSSFVVFPDGSKEGWTESDQGDEFRQALLDHLDSGRDAEDGSTPLDWCLVQYGDENGDNRMLRASSKWIDVTGHVIEAETHPGRPG